MANDSQPAFLKRIRAIDSHTAGEPTRVVLQNSGGPVLTSVGMEGKRDELQRKFSGFMRGVTCEPRGSDVLVGALEVEPSDATCATGVIFFNNVGCLGMCGHGLIGFVASLAHAGRMAPGTHRIDTPVGVVEVTLESNRRVRFENVPAWREAKAVEIDVPGCGRVRGDVAWGGNWFFLCAQDQHGIPLELDHLGRLSDFSEKVRVAIRQLYPEVDHIELTGPAMDPRNDGRNFVLCPGLAYDRSPCGTGTSAKMACLHADGKLKPGDHWHQEGILGTVFQGSIQMAEGDSEKIVPTVIGEAFVTAEMDLLFDPEDPFCNGIGA